MLTQDVVSANTLPTVCRIYILIIFIIYHSYHIYHHNLLITSILFITFVLFFKAYGRNHLHFVYLSEKILLSDMYDARTIEFTEVH